MTEEKCTKCGLHKVAVRNKIDSVYPKNTKILLAFIAEAPGAEEEREGIPLVGPAGQNFNRALAKAGINRETVFVGNICRCRSAHVLADGTRENRTPSIPEMAMCLPYLLEELKEVQPATIVTMGLTASKAIMGNRSIKMGDIHGKVFDGEKIMGFPCKIIPTWHPSPTTFINAPNRFTQLCNSFKLAKRESQGIKIQRNWTYIVVDNYSTWRTVYPLLEEAEHITFDIETATLDYLDPKARITNVGLTCLDSFGISVVCDNNNWTSDQFGAFKEEVKYILENKPIVGHWLSFDTKYIRKQWEVCIDNWLWDTALGNALIDPGGSNRLKDIIYNYSEEMAGYELELGQFGGLLSATAYQRTNYNIDDLVATERCYKKQSELVNKNGRGYLMSNIVMPSAPIFTDMEYRGVRIDTLMLQKLKIDYQRRIKDIKTKLYLHGTIMRYNEHHSLFNPSSSTQIAIVLFDKKFCGYTPYKRTKQTQEPSTDKDTLKHLLAEYKSDLCELLLEHSKLKKIYGTYLEGIENKLVKGRVHTTYHMDITKSGRTSSSDPNLQNIASDSDIKSLFIPDPSFLFIELDYKQMELAVSTYYTHDKIMIEAVESGDAHSYIGKLIFGKEVDEKNRRFIKTLNFGILYGMGYKKLARELGIKMEEAKELITQYFSLMKDTHSWIQTKRNQAKFTKVVDSKFGRIRKYEDDDENETYNSAINHPIQSCASDLMLYAMVQWKNYLVKEGYYGTRAYMVLQVHDSIVTAVEEGLAKDLIIAKKQIFENVKFKFMTLPLRADIAIGTCWGETKKLNF